MNRGLRKELALLTGLASVGLLLRQDKTWATLLGVGTAGLLMAPSKTYSFKNRSVIITGGSRGLGLALAQNFLQEGASVALLARDVEELNRAEAILQEFSVAEGEVMTVPCDVTQPTELQAAFAQIEAQLGRLDILVNNAGTISVGPFETMEQEDFQALLNLQVNAVVNAIQLALPAFQRRGGGQIVNICSIGGAVPVPHMSTYCAGKFALAGLSESVSAELAPYNIHVTTVYPGFMRTGSPIQAVFKGDTEKEYGWFAAGDVLPGFSVSADEAAKRIINGVRHGDAEVIFPWVTKVGMLGHALFPEIYACVMRGAARLLPQGKASIRKTGAESQAWLERQFWYKPLKGIEETAEAMYNQQEKHDADFNLGIQ